MGDFNAHKWFKKQYLEEGHTEDKMERDMEARKRSKLSPDELKKLDAMRAFYRGETDVLPAELKEDDLNESMIESQFDDLNQVVRNIHHVGEYGSLEEAAAEAMERIGQEFGIAFEFGRDYQNMNTLQENRLEGLIREKLCKKGEAYRKRRMAAGEKSSAYLSGRAVKVCKGQMSGKSKRKSKKK